MLIYSCFLFCYLKRLDVLAELNGGLSGQKRILEIENLALQTEMDEVVGELRSAEEKFGKVGGDLARLAEELRAEQVNFVIKKKILRT